MWSYNIGTPSESPKDQVRFLIGDTDSTDQLLQDGEIIYLLGQYNGAIFESSIRACEAIQAKFSRMADESVGSVKISFSQKAKGYERLKATLIQRIATETIQPYCGGISISDMIQVDQNPDRPCQPIRLHSMENQNIAPWVSSNWLWGTYGGGWGGCGC